MLSEDTLTILYVERIGGLANFGGARARIRSHGELDTSALSVAELQVVDSLFGHHRASKRSKVADGFQFRITRTSAAGTETVVVPETAVPAALVACVKDEFV